MEQIAGMLHAVGMAWRHVFGQAPADLSFDAQKQSVSLGAYTLTLAESLVIPDECAKRGWMDKADMDKAVSCPRRDLVTVQSWWLLDLALSIPATRDTPEDVDVIDMACSKRMEPVIRALIDLEYQNRCSQVSENLLGN